MKRSLVLAVLVLLYLLHFDFWFWHRSEIVLGLPIGLLYHLAYCLVVSLAFAVLVHTVVDRPRSQERS